MPNVGNAGIFGKNAGTWKPADDMRGRHAGTWKNAQEVWANKDGVWQKVWERNAIPQPVTGLAITYSGNGLGWNAVASWTLSPADTDRQNVYVRWTKGGVVGAWTPLAANATSDTTPIGSAQTASVEVYVVDTGGLISPTVSANGGYAPLNAPTVTWTRIGFDRVRASWTPPAGTVSGYTLTANVGGQAPSVFAEAASTLSRDFVIDHGTTFSFDVSATDPLGRAGRTGTTGNQSFALPPAPSLSFTTTGYTQVNLSWNATPNADSYDVERAVGNGAFVVVANTTATSASIAVDQNTQYRFRVRAKGQVHHGDYSNEVRPAMGYAAYSFTQPWQATNSNVNVYKDVADGVVVPANVVTSSMVVNLSCTFSTSLASGTASRTVDYFANGTPGFYVGSKPNPWNENIGWVFGAGLSGVVARGTGWSTGPTGGFRLVGSITVYGTETVNVPAQPNGTW